MAGTLNWENVNSVWKSSNFTTVSVFNVTSRPARAFKIASLTSNCFPLGHQSNSTPSTFKNKNKKNDIPDTRRRVWINRCIDLWIETISFFARLKHNSKRTAGWELGLLVTIWNKPGKGPKSTPFSDARVVMRPMITKGFKLNCNGRAGEVILECPSAWMGLLWKSALLTVPRERS